MTNKLITPALAEAFKHFPLYSQGGRQKEAVCVCAFSMANIRWYVLEGQPECDDFTIYAIVVGMVETEYGYASINEMESITIDAIRYGLGSLHIEEDKRFAMKPLREIADPRCRSFFLNFMDVIKQ